MPTGYYSCAADDTSGLEAEQAINRLSAFPYIEVDSVDEQHSRAARPGARGEATRGVGETFRAAACAAEIVGDAKRFRGVARASAGWIASRSPSPIVATRTCAPRGSASAARERCTLASGNTLSSASGSMTSTR